MKLKKSEIKIILDAAHEYIPPGVEIYLFGSRVDGTSRRSSDVDILLKGKKPIDLAMLAMLKEKLEESDLPFKVDILDHHRCSKKMLENISKNIVKIYP